MSSLVCVLCCAHPSWACRLHPSQEVENHERGVVKSSSEEMTFKLRTKKQLKQEVESLQESPEDTEKEQQVAKNTQPNSTAMSHQRHRAAAT